MTTLSRSNPAPLHAQLRGWLLGRLESGDFGHEGLLPSERELELQHGVSRVTVRRALNDLAQAGYIVREPGRGSFVVQKKIQHSAGRLGGLTEDLTAQGLRISSRMLEHGWRIAPAHVARMLQVAPNATLLFERRLVFANGEPLVLGHGYHNVDRTTTFSDSEWRDEFVFALLRRKLGIRFTRLQRSMEATTANEDEAHLLEVSTSSPMLAAELVVHAEDNRVISYRRALYRGDRYKYSQWVDL